MYKERKEQLMENLLSLFLVPVLREDLVDFSFFFFEKKKICGSDLSPSSLIFVQKVII